MSMAMATTAILGGAASAEAMNSSSCSALTPGMHAQRLACQPPLAHLPAAASWHGGSRQRSVLGPLARSRQMSRPNEAPIEPLASQASWCQMRASAPALRCSQLAATFSLMSTPTAPLPAIDSGESIRITESVFGLERQSRASHSPAVFALSSSAGLAWRFELDGPTSCRIGQNRRRIESLRGILGADNTNVGRRGMLDSGIGSNRRRRRKSRMMACRALIDGNSSAPDSHISSFDWDIPSTFSQPPSRTQGPTPSTEQQLEEYLGIGRTGLRQQCLASVAVQSRLHGRRASVRRSRWVQLWLLPAAFTFIVIVGWYILRRIDAAAAEALQRAKIEIYGETNSRISEEDMTNNEGYRLALARIRQATMIDRALGYLRTRNEVRCLVELDRALEQNDICRVPIMFSIYDKEDVKELYRTKLRAVVDGFPLDYGKMLQLRQLLGISAQEADKLEAEVRSTSDFSI